MRAYRLLPLPFLLLTAFPAVAQDVPRVLFCSGQCFAVDAKGIRSPAPKGTALQPGQRLETGPGGYAQVRMGRETSLGISEQAKVRFERTAVVLDEGRVRMVGGQALGRSGANPVELRTADGTLTLKSPDVEVRKSGQTMVKLNAGEASLRNGQGAIALARQAVHGISAGKISGETLPDTAMMPASRRPLAVSAPVATAPVAAPLTPITISTSLVREPVLLSPTFSTTTLTSPTLTPVVSSGDMVLRQPVMDSATGTTTTLTKVITEPVLTTTTTTTTATKSLTLQPVTTTLSPTLTTTTTLLRQ